MHLKLKLKIEDRASEYVLNQEHHSLAEIERIHTR